MKMKPALESEYQKTLCDFLSLKGYFFWRNNNIPVFDSAKKTFRAMPKYSKKGVPDIVVFAKGKVVFVEVKRPGGKLSEEQVVFKDACGKVGIQYIVATHIDDLVQNGL